jgi:ABC-type transport system substrate-binding protein
MGIKFFVAATAFTAGITTSVTQAGEPKHGGILKIYHRETPPSLSIHEEATFSVNIPMMGVFNNLVVYDQHKPQNSIQTIVPELATSWAWDQAGSTLTFKLREGVTWHDGKPFTAKDVKCTFDLIQGKGMTSSERIRVKTCSTIFLRSPPMVILRWHCTSSGRSHRCSRCSHPAIRQCIPVT